MKCLPLFNGSAHKGGAVLLALLLGGGVEAGSITYQASTGNPSTANWDKTLQVNQFNSAAGNPDGIATGAILSGISIDFSGTGVFTYGVENKSLTEGTSGTVSLKVDLALNGPGVTLNIEPNTGQLVLDLGTYDGLADDNGSSGKFFDNVTSSAESNQTAIGSAFFGAYTGTGLVNFNVSAITGLVRALVGGSPSDSAFWRASAGLAVTYAYEEGGEPPPPSVPEPGSLLLLGIGLFGMSQVRRQIL